jgi:quinol monooxygenase YgiN
MVAAMSDTVIVVGSFEVEPSDRDAFLQSRVPGMETARSENGCVTYVLSADPVEPGLVHLFERWKSRTHLDEHLEGLRSRPPAAAGGAPAVAARRVELTVYETSSEGPLTV